MAVTIETTRLRLRELNMEDAAFILELLNEPAFIRFIGDRGVKSLTDAQGYIHKGPVSSYARHGFGLWLVEKKESSEAIGICGLIKRDTLPDVDIGYAFLARHWSRGYAVESAVAVKDYGVHTLNLKRLVAIIDPDNHASAKVLEKIGLKFERMIKLTENEPDLKLFAFTDY